MSAKSRYGVTPVLLLGACMALTACSSFQSGSGNSSTSAINPVNWITPYKVDIIQGNFVSSEQVAQLRAGMSRDQVKQVMGTPLLASVFHADRWDYVFTLKRQGIEPQSFKYTVYFKGDRLERFEGDAMPSEAEFISKLDNKRKLGEVPPLQATEDQMKAAEKSSSSASSGSKSAGTAAASPAVAPRTTAYPPLEAVRP